MRFEGRLLGLRVLVSDLKLWRAVLNLQRFEKLVIWWLQVGFEDLSLRQTNKALTFNWLLFRLFNFDRGEPWLRYHELEDILICFRLCNDTLHIYNRRRFGVLIYSLDFLYLRVIFIFNFIFDGSRSMLVGSHRTSLSFVDPLSGCGDRDFQERPKRAIKVIIFVTFLIHI